MYGVDNYPLRKWAIVAAICGFALSITSIVFGAIHLKSNCNEQNISIFLLVCGILTFIISCGWSWDVPSRVDFPDYSIPNNRYDHLLKAIQNRRQELENAKQLSRIPRYLPSDRIPHDQNNADEEPKPLRRGEKRTAQQQQEFDEYHANLQHRKQMALIYNNYYEADRLPYVPLPNRIPDIKLAQTLSASAKRRRQMWDPQRSWAYSPPMSGDQQVLCLHSPMPYDEYWELRYKVFLDKLAVFVILCGPVFFLGMLIWGTYMVSRIDSTTCNAMLYKSALGIVISNWAIPTLFGILLLLMWAHDEFCW